MASPMMDDFLDALCNALSKYQPPRLLDLLWIWTVSAIMGNWTRLWSSVVPSC
jgi:hypothetical protein